METYVLFVMKQFAKGITDIGYIQKTRGHLIQKRRKEISIIHID